MNLKPNETLMAQKEGKQRRRKNHRQRCRRGKALPGEFLFFFFFRWLERNRAVELRTNVEIFVFVWMLGFPWKWKCIGFFLGTYNIDCFHVKRCHVIFPNNLFGVRVRVLFWTVWFHGSINFFAWRFQSCSVTVLYPILFKVPGS